MNLFLIHGLNRLSRIENIFFIRRLMSTRYRSGRSNRNKNSINPEKEGGDLEWVCVLEILTVLWPVITLFQKYMGITGSLSYFLANF